MPSVYFDAMSSLMQEFRVNKMSRRAQMPVKNLIILTILIVIIFLIVGGVVWYFYGGTLSKEIELSLPENATALDLAVLEAAKGMVEEAEFISEETGLSSEEALYLTLAIESQRANYPYLNVNDSYELAYMDLLDYEEHITEDVSLPEAYLETVESPNSQMGVALELKSGISFNEVLGNITNQTVNPLLAGDFDLLDIIMDSTYEYLNTTPLEFEKSFCTLGATKIVTLRADSLILEKEINYIYDQIIYGPDGKIISDLSFQNKDGFSFQNMTGEEFIFFDLVIIPLEYEEGTYVVEYFIKNELRNITSIVKVPIKCERRFFIDGINFVSFDDVGVFTKEDNLFSAGELISFEYWLGGFEEDLNNESNQIQLKLTFYDQESNPVTKINFSKEGGIILNKFDYLYGIDFLVLPENFSSGNYLLELEVNDLLSGNVANTIINFGIK